MMFDRFAFRRRALVAALLAIPFAVWAGEPGQTDPPLPDGSEAAAKQVATFRLPPGLKAEVFAAEPQLASPVAICVDEQGRVYVAEEFRFNRGTEENRTRPFLLEDDLQIQSLDDRLAVYRKYADKFEGGMNWFSKFTDQVRRLEDKDGDGRADASTVFAAGFNEPLDGLAAGLIAREGNVYLTNIPHLWKLRDDDGDGVAEKRTKLLTGFGVNCGFLGHDLHGLAWGPDGKLYFSVGDRGFRVETGGRTLGEPRRGAIFRCNVDGSEFEVVHRGLRNPQEIAFDDWGNLFAADNNCDKGDHSRLVYVVEGGDSGWNMAYQTIPAPYETGPWHAEKMWHLDGAPEEAARPAWVLPAVGKLGAGPSGFAYCGAVGWPANVRGRFYLCNYTGNGGIESFAVKAKGASFEIVDPQDFFKPISATDCEFGYDGKLYVSDFVGLDWAGKTKGGRIFTVHSPDKIAEPAVKEVQALFRAGLAERSAQELAALLGHADQRVRQRAQFALAERGEHAVLLAALGAKPEAQDEASRLARLHALWALGQLARTTKALGPELAKLLNAADPVLQANAARIVGELKLGDAAPKLIELLQSEHAAVQLQAALALGKAAPQLAAEPLFQLLQTNANRDKYLRHAAVHALSLGGDVAAVKAKVDDKDAAVRMGALLVYRRWSESIEVGWKPVSLKQPNFAAEIARFLLDPEMDIVVEAARAINDLHLDEAQPQLAAVATSILRAPEGAPEALVRRVINANFRLGGAEQATAVGRLAAEAKLSTPLRREALESLADWGQPPRRDRVTGYWRPVVGERKLDAVRPAMEAAIPNILASATGDLAPVAAKVVAKLELKTDDATFVAWAGEQERPVATRAAALQLLGSRKHPQFGELSTAALADANSRYRAEALRIVTAIDPARALAACSVVLNSNESDVVEKQQALASLVALKQPSGDELLVDWMGRLARRTAPAPLHLDVLEAAQARGTPALGELLKNYENGLPADDSLARYRITAEGGDVERGREVFFGHRQGQCVRCHKIEGRGGDAGPDFTRLASNIDRRYVVQSLVHPDAMIAEGFGNLTLRLSDGSVIGGRLKRKRDEGLELILPDGQTKIIPHSEIDQRSELKSAMPAMDKTLTLREMRDLVEFLMTRK